MSAGLPFSYQFLDESFDDMYRVEQRTGKLGLNICHHRYFNCMPWFIWIGYLYGRTTD